MSELLGVLNLNKPAGITSRRAIDSVARLARPAKVGHAGTLDPLATGVLVVCVGNATRLIEYIQDLPKEYRATFLLGRSSSTEDIEGDVVELSEPPRPSPGDVKSAAAGMIGGILQRPPAFSALKVAGQRAYALARRGQEFELQPRPVTIHSIRVVSFEYPQLTLDIRCGSGTYVRSLGRDLAEKLGTKAVMSALVRTAIGHFSIDDAVEPAKLDRQCVEENLIAPADALRHLESVVLSDDQIKILSHGKPITDLQHRFAGPVAALTATGRLVAVLQPTGPEEYRSERFFPADDVGSEPP